MFVCVEIIGKYYSTETQLKVEGSCISFLNVCMNGFDSLIVFERVGGRHFTVVAIDTYEGW